MDVKNDWTQAATWELGASEQLRFLSDIQLMPMLDRTQAAIKNCPSTEATGSCTCSPKGKGEMHHGTGDRMMVYNWETHLLHEDDCFFYSGDETGAAAFTKSMGGQTPKEDAGAFRKQHGYSGRHSNEELVEQLLKFWADRVELWKVEYKSESHARAIWYRRVKEYYHVIVEKPQTASEARRIAADINLISAVRAKGMAD